MLWDILCFEEERKRFNILHGDLSLCHPELPVMRESKLWNSCGLSFFFAQSMSVVRKRRWFDFIILCCFIFPASPPSSTSGADADGLGKATLNLKVT